MCLCCCNLARILFHLLQYDIICETTVTQSSLFDLLTLLFKKLSSAITDFVRKDGIGQMKPVIHKLSDLFCWSQNVGSDNLYIINNVIRAVMPAKVVDLIMDIVIEKVS